jgi:hypothetical protein
MLRQRRRTGSRETVGTPALFARESLDKSKAFEPRQCLIRSAWLEFDGGKLNDVLNQRVPVLVATSKAGEYERRDSRIFAETVGLSS